MSTEFIDRQWVIDNGGMMHEIRVLENYYPNGGEALEVLKTLIKNDCIYDAIWFFERLSFTNYEKVTELEKITDDYFIHFGSVHVKQDIELTGTVLIKNDLIVDGKLTVSNNGILYALTVSAHELCIKHKGRLCGEFQANDLIHLL